MSTVSEPGMIDILQLESSMANNDVSYWLILFCALLVLYITFLMVRYYHHPVRRLRRQLRKQQCSAREVAHQIAYLFQFNASQTTLLEKMRFAKEQPTSQQILDFIQMIDSQ